MNEEVDLSEWDARGYVIPLETCNLVFVTKGNSLLACGAVDVDALDKLSVPAAKITGVSTVQELLDGNVKAMNQAAAARGVQAGDRGHVALLKL